MTSMSSYGRAVGRTTTATRQPQPGNQSPEQVKMRNCRRPGIMPDRLQFPCGAPPRRNQAGWNGLIVRSVIAPLLQALVGWGRNRDSVSSGG